MAKLTLVYGLRLLPSPHLAQVGDATPNPNNTHTPHQPNTHTSARTAARPQCPCKSSKVAKKKSRGSSKLASTPSSISIRRFDVDIASRMRQERPPFTFR